MSGKTSVFIGFLHLFGKYNLQTTVHDTLDPCAIRDEKEQHRALSHISFGDIRGLKLTTHTDFGH